MKEPRQMTPMALQGAARGRGEVRSAAPGRQQITGPVKCSATLQIEWEADGERPGRERGMALLTALGRLGFRFDMDGPTVEPLTAGPQRRGGNTP